MSRTEVVLEFPITMQAGATIADNRLVKVDTDGTVIPTSDGDLATAYVNDGGADLSYVAIDKVCGRILCVASGEIAAGDYVKADDDGKVQTQATAEIPEVVDPPSPAVPATNDPDELTIGIAVTSSASDDDPIYIVAFK
jgi:hypothetical protein